VQGQVDVQDSFFFFWGGGDCVLLAGIFGML
jgi:hypothetical protein